jgi:hypothetical protein
MGDPFRYGGGVTTEVTPASSRIPDRRITCREGRLYEGGQPLKIRTSAAGVAVGCTVVSWEAFDAIVRRVNALGGRE